VRAQLRTLLGQTAIYGLGGGAAQAIGVLTLPVFSRALDKAEYGTLEIYTATVAMAIVIVDLGLGAAAQRFFYDHRDEEVAARSSVISTAFFTSTAFSFVIAAIILLARKPISQRLFDTQPNAKLVVLLAVSLPLLAAANMTREVMRLSLQPWRYLTSTFISTVGGALLGVLAVTTLDTGVNGIIASIVIVAGVAALYGVVVIRTLLRGRYDVAGLRRMLRYGVPLIPGMAALWATAYADRVLLDNIKGLDTVGLYGIAARFAAPVLLVMTAFVTAYYPFLFSLQVDQPELEKELRGRIATFSAVALLGVGLPFAVFGPELISVVAPGYDGAAGAISPLVLSTAAYGVAAVLGVPIFLHRRTGVGAVLSGLMAVANIALCLALIPPFGLEGAAAAAFGGYALLAVMYWWWGRSVDDAPYEPVRLVAAFALAAAAGEAWRIDLSSGALTLILKLAVCAAFVVGLRLAHVIRPEDLGAVREIVERRLRTTRDPA
jgi:O-antigen/teichoic acid export membrane protein